MGLRSIAAFALCTLAAGSVACGSTSETTGDSEDAVTYIAGFHAGSYFQIDKARPTTGEITLIMFGTPTTYWAERCVNHACDVIGINGSYKRSKTRLYLDDAQGARIGTWSYTLHSGTLTLHEIGSSDRYALDPMSESLCDGSGGAWSDDELGKYGFNCSCPGEMDWGPSGCEPCPDTTCGTTCTAPLTACSGSCVDLKSDPTNCGACNTGCAKTQGCQQGQCAACPTPLWPCSSRCVDRSTSATNCGACGNACAQGQTCVNGACQ